MTRPVIQWGVAERALPGEPESGDRCAIKVAANRATIAVIDGLGHGSEAALASRTAVSVVEDYAHEPLVSVLKRCHERLRSTRGAAMTLVRFDAAERSLTWLGAGNVKAVLVPRNGSGTVRYSDMLIYSGAVGVKLPTLEALSRPADAGDTLILATDGIDPSFTDAVRNDEHPQAQADRLLADYQSGADDALILVARLNR